MKKILCLIATALFCWACQHSPIGEPAQEEGTATLAFDILNYEQTSLDDITRATTATTLAHLDMAVYDATSRALVLRKQTVPGDDTYGSFSATLPYGEYIFVFLGYDGSRTAVLDSPTSISFADNYVPNCFLKKLELSVSAQSETNQSIALARCVAAFSVRSEGTIPQGLKQITGKFAGGSHHLNALTGLADATEERTVVNTVSNDLPGKESMTINYYTFLSAEEASMTITVTATEQNGTVIRSREFANVPMKINQRTTYRGNFFALDERTQSFTLQLENDAWDEQEYNY